MSGISEEKKGFLTFTDEPITESDLSASAPPMPPPYYAVPPETEHNNEPASDGSGLVEQPAVALPYTEFIEESRGCECAPNRPYSACGLLNSTLATCVLILTELLLSSMLLSSIMLIGEGIARDSELLAILGGVVGCLSLALFLGANEARVGVRNKKTYALSLFIHAQHIIIVVGALVALCVSVALVLISIVSVRKRSDRTEARATLKAWLILAASAAIALVLACRFSNKVLIDYRTTIDSAAYSAPTRETASGKKCTCGEPYTIGRWSNQVVAHTILLVSFIIPCVLAVLSLLLLAIGLFEGHEAILAMGFVGGVGSVCLAIAFNKLRSDVNKKKTFALMLFIVYLALEAFANAIAVIVTASLLLYFSLLRVCHAGRTPQDADVIVLIACFAGIRFALNYLSAKVLYDYRKTLKAAARPATAAIGN